MIQSAARHTLAALLFLALGASVTAPPAAAQDLGLRGWGPRIGAGDNPDQILIGIHADLGTFVTNLRFQPSMELGFGDRHTIFSVTIPVHWKFRVSPDFTPYAGGGIIASFIDFDHPQRRRSGWEFDLAPMAAGGIEWHRGAMGTLFLELNLAGGDTHDARLWFGWTF
jgi:hypothetical protein